MTEIQLTNFANNDTGSAKPSSGCIDIVKYAAKVIIALGVVLGISLAIVYLTGNYPKMTQWFKEVGEGFEWCFALLLLGCSGAI